MRKLYDYQVVRYFPDSLTDEFINIGIMLNSDLPIERIIEESDAKKLYCSTFLGDSKKFYAIIEHLHKLSKKNSLRSTTHYFHNFTFSNNKHLASSQNQDEILEKLFDRYIGTKLEREEKLDKRQRLLRDSYQMATKEFGKYISMRHSEHFDLEIEHKKNHKIYYSNLGSLVNKQDVSNMSMETPIKKKDNTQYHFLNISTHNTSNDFEERLLLNEIQTHSYTTDEEIFEYLNSIQKAI